MRWRASLISIFSNDETRWISKWKVRDHLQKAGSMAFSWQKLHLTYLKTSWLLLLTALNELSDKVEQRWWLTWWSTGQKLTDEWNVLKTMSRRKALVIKQTIQHNYWYTPIVNKNRHIIHNRHNRWLWE